MSLFPKPALLNDMDFRFALFCSWFHGKITRDQAEELLNPREDGLYLVRESTNFPGDYTLCVCFHNKVEHYRVIYKDNHLTIDEEEFFENLTQLVEVMDVNGICMIRLKIGVRKWEAAFVEKSS